jgi:hypothetical protein
MVTVKCKNWEELIFVIFTPINKLIEIKAYELKVDKLKVDKLKVDEIFLSRRTDLARHLGSSSLFDLIHKSM